MKVIIDCLVSYFYHISSLDISPFGKMTMMMTMMTLITDMKVLMKNLDTWDKKRGGQSYTK